MASKKIRGITVQLGGDTSGLQKALKQVDIALGTTQKELNEVRKALKIDPTNVKLLKQEEELLGQAAKQTADRLKLLEDAQTKVNKAADAWPDYEKRYKPIQEAIDKTTERLKKLKAEEEEFKTKHEKGQISDDEYKKFISDLNAAKKAAGEARKAKKELDDEFKAKDGFVSPEQYREYERDVEKTKHELKELEGQMVATGEASTKINGSFSEFSGNAKKHAKDLVKAFAAVTAAVLAAGKSAVTAGMNFEQSMKAVAAIMGYSVEELADSGSEAAQTYEMLSQFAQELGKSTVFTANEASEGLQRLALAGYDVNTSMAMLPKVLNLAAAGELDLAQASEIAVNTQSALGLSVEDTAVLIDQMAKIASKTNTSVGQLGEGMLKIGGTARSLKGGTAELAVELGVLANNGIKGAEGGTKLRNVILTLQKAAKDGQIAIGDMNVAIYDTVTGEMRDLPSIFLDISAAMGSMTEAEADALKAGLFHKQDLAAVNAMLGTTAEKWAELTAQVEDSAGAAQKMADTRLDNLAGDITLFKSAVEGAKISLTNDLTPSLRKATQVGTKAVTEMSKGFGKGGLSGAVEAANKIINTELGESAKTIFGLETATKAAATAWLTYKAAAILENTINALRVVNAGLAEGKTLTEAMNSAMLKNPYAIIAAVAISAVTAIKKLIDIETDIIDEVGTGYDVLSEKQQAVVDANAALVKSMEDSKSKFEESTRAAEIEADTAERLADRLFELDDVETLSAANKAEMKMIVDQLNSSVEGLNVQLDEETGHLKTERSEIEAGIKAMQKRAKAAAAEERYVELYKQQITAEKNRADAIKQEEEAVKDLEKAEVERNKAIERRRKFEEQYTRDGNMTASKQQIAEMNEVYDSAIKKYEEAETALAEMRNAHVLAGQALGDVNREIAGLTDIMNADEIKTATDKATGAFDELADSAENAAGKTGDVFTITEEEVEDTLSKIDELTDAYNSKIDSQESMLENWVEKNLEIDDDQFSLTDWQNVLNGTYNELDNWDKSIQELAARSDDKGKLISDGLLDHLKTMGPEGIKYVNALSSGTDAELRMFSEMWDKTYKSIPEIAAGQYEELRKTTDRKINDMLGDVRDQNAAVRGVFNQLGLNGIDGYIAAWNDPEKRAELEAAVRGAVSTAIDAAADEQESESPSKVFRRLGNYAGQGYALGIDDEVANTIKSVSQLVSNAVTAASGVALPSPDIAPISLPADDVTAVQQADTQTAGGMTADDIKMMFSEMVSGNVTLPLVIDSNGQQVIAEVTAPKINVLLGDELGLETRGY